MRQLLITIIILLYSCLALAKPDYQIDLILFAQNAHTKHSLKESINLPLIPIPTNAIVLKTNSAKVPKPYYLLPRSYSSLKDHDYLLSRKSSYPVLGHYSWRQPASNQSRVALPLTEHHGWKIQGTLQITQSTYYYFNATLQASSPDTPQTSFTVIQKQRLKSNVIYYLDHEQLGMLVRIHPIS